MTHHTMSRCFTVELEGDWNVKDKPSYKSAATSRSMASETDLTRLTPESEMNIVHKEDLKTHIYIYTHTDVKLPHITFISGSEHSYCKSAHKHSYCKSTLNIRIENLLYTFLLQICSKHSYCKSVLNILIVNLL